MPYDLIIESVIKGVKRGMAKYPVKAGLIHIVPRALSLKESEDATAEMLKYKAGIGKDLIVGFDLADGEEFGLIENFKSVLELARSAGLGLTVHSGENTSSEHVRKTIEFLGVQRIGHGIKVMEDPKVMELALKGGIHFEVCPTSNWLTRCVDKIEDHPIKKMLDYGLSVGLNSDDPHIMNIDLTHEYEVCHRFLNLKESDFIKMNDNAMRASFLN